jgi:transposase-like protein
MSDYRSRIVALLVLLAAVGAALAGGWLVTAAIDLPTGPEDYNLVRWEVRHLFNKWLYQAGTFLRGGPSEAEKTRRLERFLALNAQIASLERRVAQNRESDGSGGGDPAILDDLATLRQERDRLENVVEAVLEERVARVAREVGLESSLPLFPGARWLFPPVDFEFAAPPQVLAISPRDRIHLESTRLLRSDLTLEEIEEVERRREAESVSALVVGVGGVGTYPSAVSPSADYSSLLETVAHEWLHHYLFFRPLGFRYFQDPALATINETVASMAGRELGALVEERYPLSASQPAGQVGRGEVPPRQTEPDIDFSQVMRELRLEVDRLLDEGKVAEAESLMEEKRRFLAEHGYFIRRINQAYFAFHGLYADTPASSSPIGPKLEKLRQRSASLGDFIHTAADITSEAALDHLLAQGG